MTVLYIVTNGLLNELSHLLGESTSLDNFNKFVSVCDIIKRISTWVLFIIKLFLYMLIYNPQLIKNLKH